MGCWDARVARVLLALTLTLLQALRFEPVQPELFGLGGSFVNAWADYDADGDPDLFVGFDGAPNRWWIAAPATTRRTTASPRRFARRWPRRHRSDVPEGGTRLTIKQSSVDPQAWKGKVLRVALK